MKIILGYIIVLFMNVNSAREENGLKIKLVNNNPGSAQIAGKGTITCDIDGKPKTFSPAQSFFEINLDPYSKGPKDGIEILDGSLKKEGFQFEIKKNGQTKITSGAAGDINCIINYYNQAGIVYTGDNIIVNVISYNQNHLTCTFSGKLVNVSFDGTGPAKNYPQYIQVTNGKIDLEK